MVYYLRIWNKNLNFSCHFITPKVILSLSKLSIASKSFFYKSCLVFYTTWEFGSHFVTFCTKHQIEKEKTFQRLFSYVCYWRMSHKNWQFFWHSVKKSHFITLKTIYQIEKILLQKLSSLVYCLRMSNKKWKLIYHLLTNQPFCHFLN